MAIELTRESCRGCRCACSTVDLRCPYCGYDYYEEVYWRPRAAGTPQPSAEPVPSTPRESLGDRLCRWWHNWRNRHTSRAYHQLCKAMQDDPGYAESWQCNIACVLMDANICTHGQANKVADRLMAHLFSVKPVGQDKPKPAVLTCNLCSAPLPALEPGEPECAAGYLCRACFEARCGVPASKDCC